MSVMLADLCFRAIDVTSQSAAVWDIFHSLPGWSLIDNWVGLLCQLGHHPT